MSCCPPITIQSAIHGVVSITKAITGIDNADATIIQLRRDICRNCEFAIKHPIIGLCNISRCQKCGCLIEAKTKLTNEKCPIGIW